MWTLSLTSLSSKLCDNNKQWFLYFVGGRLVFAPIHNDDGQTHFGWHAFMVISVAGTLVAGWAAIWHVSGGAR